MDYYWISINNDIVSTIAYAPKGTPVSHQLIETIETIDVVPFSLELHDVIISKTIIQGGLSDVFYDFQPNSLAWPIMSEKMSHIIASHLTGFEGKEYISTILSALFYISPRYIGLRE